MSTEIVIPEVGLTVPIELPGVTDALANLSEVEKRVETLYGFARGQNVNDEATCNGARELLTSLKAEKKNATAYLTPYKSIVQRVKDFLLQREQRVTNRCEEGIDILNRKIGDYVRPEEAAAEKEADKINRGREKRGEEPVEVSPGTPAGRKYFSAECVDPNAFLSAYICEVIRLTPEKHAKRGDWNALSGRFAKYIRVSGQALSAEARTLRDQAEEVMGRWPGIKLTETRKF